MENKKFFERLIILIVLFLGITIATAYIIGNYVGQKKSNEKKNDYSIVLENI